MVSLKIQLPQDFLNEEVRCGYVISQRMKEVWAVQLDLLAELDRVCRKYGIHYVASGGTLLGAVRHHGFIPWDDDVDLMMPREEYDKLCSLAEKEFEHPYFFQTEYSDHGFMRGFARLRNSETSGIQKFELNKSYKFNQGIFIDIFPLDEVVSDNIKLNNQGRKAHRLYALSCILSEMTDRYPPNSIPRWKYIYKTIGHYFLGGLINRMRLQDFFLKKYEKVCAKYNGTNQTTVSLLSFQFNNRRHDLPVYKSRDIEYVNFEFVKIPIPPKYQEHLTNKYGDYMKPMKFPNYHGDVMFDVNRSYKEILNLQ